MRQNEQEARDREAGTLQAKRKAGKRKFHVEDHFDDCGEDLSNIGGEDMDMFVGLIDFNTCGCYFRLSVTSTTTYPRVLTTTTTIVANFRVSRSSMILFKLVARPSVRFVTESLPPTQSPNFLLY